MDELAKLKPLCRELRQDKASAEREASGERGRAKAESDCAERAEEKAAKLKLEFHEEKSRMSWGAVVGWTAVVSCSAVAEYGASQRGWKLVAGGGVVIWRW